MKKESILIIAIFLISFSAISQANKKFIDTGSVENQIDFVINKSNNYQEYKVVQKTWLYRLKSHVIDSVKSLKNEIQDNKTLISSQNSKIDSLSKILKSTNTDLASVNKEKDRINFLGIQTTKPVYNTILWTIIGGLLAFTLFFIFKFKNSNTLTKNAENSLKEIEEEFEEHRKTALEREQKVRRQLQDELNKQKKD